MAKGKRTGGRPKGSPNRVTRIMKETLAEKLIAGEIESFEKMKEIAAAMYSVAAKALKKAQAEMAIAEADKTGKTKPPDLRLPMALLDAAQRAYNRICEYERPKLASIQMEVKPVDLTKVPTEDLIELRRIAGNLYAAEPDEDRGIRSGADETAH